MVWYTDLSVDTQHSVSAHENRRIQEQLKWNEIRDRLVDSVIEESYLAKGTVCVWCNKSTAVARCRYCGPQSCLCLKCAGDLHSTINSFHVLELWKDGMFIPLFPNHSILRPGNHQCSSVEVRTVNCIDEHGNHHIKKIAFCQCEPPVLTLIRLQLWPGSPDRPTTAFHFRLMDLAGDIFIHCQVSLKQFSDFLDMKRPPLQPKIVSRFALTCVRENPYESFAALPKFTFSGSLGRTWFEA